MAYGEESNQQSLIQAQRSTIFRWQNNRKILTWRRKLPSIRLGGKKPRRGFFLVKLVKRIRIRWLKLKYSRLLKRLKDYYYSMVKDFIEGGATLESVQQRIMMETYLTVPVMGLSGTAAIPSVVGSNRSRPYYF